MLGRTYNSLMKPINIEWTAEALNMNANASPGADLFDEDKIVEVKFKVKYTFKYTHKSWRVLEHQLSYKEEGKDRYWALGFYTLDKEISRIKTVSPFILEDMVKEREIFIVEWDWMKQFKKHHHQGQTKKTKWNRYLRFPKYKLLPPVVKSYCVRKGLVHLTDGVPKDLI